MSTFVASKEMCSREVQLQKINALIWLHGEKIKGKTRSRGLSKLQKVQSCHQ